MRIIILSFALAAVACAGQPTSPPSKFIARASQAAPVAATPSNGGKLDPKIVLDAKRRGYTVVNEEGDALFCHNEARTGSHLSTAITCLTQKQMADLREQTQRGLQNVELQQPPPQSK